MEQKTKVRAENGQHDVWVTREFDLPLDLLFKAYAEADLVEQWMGTKVLKLENKQYGSWKFQTTDPHGKVVFQAHGVIHEFVPDQRIIRTFEMENAPFGVQLEFLDFEKLTDETSQLKMQIVYRSVELRDQMLQLPFAYGINMAHNRLQDILVKMK
jgi:uncharacterized protein YndB with AHSA1/START domain